MKQFLVKRIVFIRCISENKNKYQYYLNCKPWTDTLSKLKDQGHLRRFKVELKFY